MPIKYPKNYEDQKKYLRRWEKFADWVKWLVDHEVPQTIIKIIIWILQNWLFK